MIFFFNDTATTEIYTLSLHDALPICTDLLRQRTGVADAGGAAVPDQVEAELVQVRSEAGALVVVDRKSTRLNSSHANISYAVFCLKKKKKPMYGYDHGATLSEANHLG